MTIDELATALLKVNSKRFPVRHEPMGPISMIEIFTCEQGSPEWFQVRLGLPTGSEFGTVLASGRGGGESKTRRTYLYKLAAERITGDPMENYVSKDMERGKALEPEARAYYEMLNDVAIERIGFIKNGRTGCSPDGLIGKDGGLEIKVVLPHTLVAAHAHPSGTIPPEYVPQVQGNIWCSEREWFDFLLYCPKLPAFLVRVYRQQGFIDMLAESVEQFNNELDALVTKIKGVG